MRLRRGNTKSERLMSLMMSTMHAGRNVCCRARDNLVFPFRPVSAHVLRAVFGLGVIAVIVLYLRAGRGIEGLLNPSAVFERAAALSLPPRHLLERCNSSYTTYRLETEPTAKLQKLLHSQNEFVTDSIPTAEMITYARLQARSSTFKNAELAINIEYPAYALKMPHFVTVEDKSWFEGWQSTSALTAQLRNCKRARHSLFCLSADPVREVVLNDAHFTRGSLTVRYNVMLDTLRDCSDQDYLHWNSSPIARQPIARSSKTRRRRVRRVDVATYLKVYDGWSFQHFLDRGIPKYAQAFALLQQAQHLNIIARKPRSASVERLYERIGLSLAQIIPAEKRDVFYVKEFIEICNAPFIHPLLWQSIRANLFRVPSRSVGERNRIVYLQRFRKGVKNGLRRPTCQSHLLSWLRRGASTMDMEVAVFDDTEHRSVQSVIDFFGTANLVIGPHGSALFNQFFCSSGTVFIELCPVDRDDTVFWMGAHALGHVYWYVPCEGRWESDSLDCELAKIQTIVRWHLGFAI